MAEKKQSEMVIITKAKELCSYVMTVTQRSPKQFRFTFVSRMQNLALDVIETCFERTTPLYIVKMTLKQKQEQTFLYGLVVASFARQQ